MRSPHLLVDTPLTEVVFSSQRSPVLVLGNRSPYKLLVGPAIGADVVRIFPKIS
jgi:hypothetical protein